MFVENERLGMIMRSRGVWHYCGMCGMVVRAIIVFSRLILNEEEAENVLEEFDIVIRKSWDELLQLLPGDTFPRNSDI